MLVSLVLRLVPQSLDGGGLAGDVEDVASGQRQTVRNVDELIEFCRAACANRDVGAHELGTEGSGLGPTMEVQSWQ